VGIFHDEELKKLIQFAAEINSGPTVLYAASTTNMAITYHIADAPIIPPNAERLTFLISPPKYVDCVVQKNELKHNEEATKTDQASFPGIVNPKEFAVLIMSSALVPYDCAYELNRFKNCM
jgi:hypothetical protein